MSMLPDPANFFQKNSWLQIQNFSTLTFDESDLNTLPGLRIFYIEELSILE